MNDSRNKSCETNRSVVRELFLIALKPLRRRRVTMPHALQDLAAATEKRPGFARMVIYEEGAPAVAPAEINSLRFRLAAFIDREADRLERWAAEYRQDADAIRAAARDSVQFELWEGQGEWTKTSSGETWRQRRAA